MKPIRLVVAAAIICLFSPMQAMAQTFYLTSGDAGTSYIIDLNTGSFTSFSTGTQNSAYALGVTNSILLSDISNSTVVEYSLAGVPTGNTWAGPGGFSQMLDGTTNGQGAYYGASWSSTGVTVSDNTFTNTTLLFNPGFAVIGITYDSSDNTLWLVNDNDNNVYHYTLAGSQISSFTPGLSGRECCLAYDGVSDTLWMSTNGSNVISNFSKNGTLLGSVTVTGMSPGNTWGGEIALGAVVVVPPMVPVPSMGTWSVVILVVLVLGFTFYRRRASQTPA